MSSPFATLPIELVLSILSFGAAHQPTALALSLVSSWVRTHVEPTLYHTVRLSSARSLSAFISTLAHKPCGFAHRTVRRLCITALGPIASIHTILSECTGVTSIASGFSVPSYVHCVRHDTRVHDTLLAEQLYADSPDGATFGHLPSAPAEQHLLALACRDGLDTAIVSPRVARLRVQLTTVAATAPTSLARLGALRHLTHLALVLHTSLIDGGVGFSGAFVSALERVVRRACCVEVLALQVAGGTEAEAEAEACLEGIRRWGRQMVERRMSEESSEGGGRSRKLVVWASRAPRSFLSDWEEGDTFWQRAEAGGAV